ncbi:MAG: extracellular solute-binding protein [Chloroflexi bacterium]|nr:extracellular solute-binding protein [Chloroflexota bacterium]
MFSRLVGILILGALVVAACGQAATPTGPPAAPAVAGIVGKPAKPEWQEKWDSTLQAARKEGEVLVYGNVTPETRAELPRVFEQKYGITMDILVGTGPQLATKIISEYAAAVYRPDAVVLGMTTLITELKPKGVLQPVGPALLLPEVVNPKAWREERLPFTDKETQAVAMIGSYARYIAYNTSLVKESDIASFRDLLKPEWKGKMTMYDPSVNGSGNEWVGFLWSIWGMDQTREFLSQLARQDVEITRDYRLQMEWVAKGKYAIALGYRQDTLADFLAVGAPLALVKAKEGGQFTPGAGGMGMVKHPPHPSAAVILVNWLLSQEGQTLFMKGFKQPTLRLDIPTEGIVHPSLLPGPGDSGSLQDEDYIINKGKLLSVAKEAMGIK